MKRQSTSVVGAADAEKERTPKQKSAVPSARSHLPFAYVVDDLRDLPRITSGEIQLRKGKLDLAEIVRRAVDSVGPLINEKSHKLMLDIPPLPLPVYGDATRVEQIIVNLLSNAAKYTDDGGALSVIVRDNGPAITVAVKDNGVGIDPEMLQQIFEPFAQVDSSLDRARGGLGLGLTLVRHLVELHGGTAVAQSGGLGRGSTFIVSFPKLTDAAPEPIAPPGKRL